MLSICTSVPENFSETKFLLDYLGRFKLIKFRTFQHVKAMR